MNRAEKENMIQDLAKTFTENPHVILASFSGLSANQANALRRKIDESGGRYRVIKNRLAKRAAVGTPLEALADQFGGPCALVTHETDPAGLAKAVVGFIKDNPQVEIKAGLVDAKSTLAADEVVQLSKLPGLPELRAQLLALIQTPATTLVRLIGTPGTQLARVVDAHRKKQGDGGE